MSKARTDSVEWICQYSDIDNLKILFKDWEDEGELTFRTYDDSHGSTRIILDVDQVIEVRNVLNDLLEGL